MRVKLVRSLIKCNYDQLAAARALKLRRIGDVAEVAETPSGLGQVNKIKFLLEVLEPATSQGASK
jgi:ribosomal protein L30